MNIHAADLNLFVVFEALLDTQSVSKAAKRLGLSQPATSNALARLRATFDDPLFVRRGSTMLPTPRAQQVAAHVRAALGLLGVALGPPEGFDPASACRTFVIAAHDFASLAVLPSAMERVRREAPGITLRVIRSDARRPYAGLEDGSVDLVFGAVGDAPRGIAHAAFAPSPFVTAARVGHPRVRRRLTLKQFLEVDHLLVAPLGGQRGDVDRALERMGHQRRIALTVPDFLLALHVIARTDLIVTLPRKIFELAALEEELNVFVPPVEVKGRGPYGYLWDERRHSDPGHAWLRSVLRPQPA